MYYDLMNMAKSAVVPRMFLQKNTIAWCVLQKVQLQMKSGIF